LDGLIGKTVQLFQGKAAGGQRAEHDAAAFRAQVDSQVIRHGLGIRPSLYGAGMVKFNWMCHNLAVTDF
jgi:hypothetical protein